MRIAINTRFLLANRLEGMGRFTYEVAKRLVERRPNDEFIFLFDRPFDPQFVFHPRIEAVVIPPPARHPVLWWLWFELAIPSILRKKKADIFISMDGYCSLSTKVNTIMVMHDIAFVHYPDQISFLTRHYYKYFAPRYLNKANQVITVSHFCKQDMIQHYDIQATKISVSCNGVSPHFEIIQEDKKQAIRNKYSDGENYFFYIGAIHPRKNIVRLIQAFDQFKQTTQTTTKLLIAGRFAWQTGPIRKAYEASLQKDAILFLGYVSDEELPLLSGSALALTYISLFEGFGVPLIEAMKAGVPVITSKVSSMPEVGGDAALLVDPFNIEEIAAAMQAILEKPALRKKMIKKGQLQYQQFTWEKATDVMEEALDKLSTRR